MNTHTHATFPHRCRPIVLICGVITALLLVSCGGTQAPSSTMAEASEIAQIGNQQGTTPFINFVQFRAVGAIKLASVRFVIASKPDTASKPVDVTYTLANLISRGYASAESNNLTLPVFGLYAKYTNHLIIDFKFIDASKKSLALDIATAPFVDPNRIYDRPTILKRRVPGSALGFDFFAIKSGKGTPIVVDSDGELRWVGVGPTNSTSSTFHDNGFVVGSAGSVNLTRLELDGTSKQFGLRSSKYTTFHHNIDPGKFNLLGEMDSPSNVENVAVEFDRTGGILKEWDFAQLVSSYMLGQGDDPSLFVRSGIDWFHMNSATYDPRDDSLIVSSRENFIMKVDYTTGNIIWILGDPTKYWHTFASLRAKALTLAGDGLYPVGQHATSITSDGLLMVFNDGKGSLNNPSGASAGESRTYSAVSTYRIDPATKMAVEAWRFDYNQSIYSDICSSAYEASEKSLLVNFSVADQRTHARLVGLNAAHQVVFDYQYPTINCQTSWNAIPIAFEKLQFN